MVLPVVRQKSDDKKIPKLEPPTNYLVDILSLSLARVPEYTTMILVAVSVIKNRYTHTKINRTSKEIGRTTRTHTHQECCDSNKYMLS